ncbi:hypothetical protein FP66_01665 [Halomonas salina]|uniref:Uncharacterized protein n=1 Tax=Halomonas salina TaxID=42565 RepID=A0ABR4WVK1_9GAMM|nr:hypothetical protein FP66_01665 [Halomonas salina]
MHGYVASKIYVERNPTLVSCIEDSRTVSVTYLHFDAFIFELDVVEIPAFLLTVSGSFGYKFLAGLNH